MAKPIKKRFPVVRDVNIGVKKDGEPRKTYKRGDFIYLKESQIDNYKKNNII